MLCCNAHSNNLKLPIPTPYLQPETSNPIRRVVSVDCSIKLAIIRTEKSRGSQSNSNSNQFIAMTGATTTLNSSSTHRASTTTRRRQGLDHDSSVSSSHVTSPSSSSSIKADTSLNASIHSSVRTRAAATSFCYPPQLEQEHKKSDVWEKRAASRLLTDSQVSVLTPPPQVAV